VSDRRYTLGVKAFTKRPLRRRVKWTPEIDALLGTMSDATVAGKLHCTELIVFNRRRRLKVKAFSFTAALCI
jgi:hypothetical protein